MFLNRDTETYIYSHKHGFNYRLFNRFIEVNRHAIERDLDSLMTLGPLSFNDNAYFVKSDECKKNAGVFLKGFFSSEEHRDKVISAQSKKKQEESFPSCISFIDIIINNKKYCFVSLSGGVNDKEESMTLLKDYINSLENNSDPEYVLIGGNSDNISKLIANLQSSASEDIFKPCAEKYLVSALIKIFLKYGENAIVTGAVNCSFYPYQYGKFYGLKENSRDKWVINPFGEKLNLGDGLFVTSLPCCSLCKGNKKSSLLALKCAQKYGKDQSIQFTTSPIIHSFKSGTSLVHKTLNDSVWAKNSENLDSEEESDDNTMEDETSVVSQTQIDQEDGLEVRTTSPTTHDLQNIPIDESQKKEVKELIKSTDRPPMETKPKKNTQSRKDKPSKTSGSPLFNPSPNKEKSKIVMTEMTKRNKKLLDKENSFDELDYFTSLFVTAFNKHHKLQKINLHADKWIRDNLELDLENFVFDNWDTLKLIPHHNRIDYISNLVKHSYAVTKKTEGFLCCKRTIAIVSFNQRDAFRFINKHDENFYDSILTKLASKEHNS